MANPKIKAVFFDFMGTCLDWHTGAVGALPQSIPPETRSALALDWRHTYFDTNAARVASNLPVEDFDLTLRKTLDAILPREAYAPYAHLFDETTRVQCVKAWHSMPAWPDVVPAIAALKEAGYEVYVSANGTTRLQLDLCKSSGLHFDMLFSSELLGTYKPALENFQRTLELVRRQPQECVQVAAHAWDNRGAKAVGMRTVYVRRWTDDIAEDMHAVEDENDCFLEDMKRLVEVIGQL
jgi:2-haloalkanoic acid dehalogenase type II